MRQHQHCRLGIGKLSGNQLCQRISDEAEPDVPVAIE